MRPDSGTGSHLRWQRRRLQAGWLLLALLAAWYCAWRFAGPTPLQTNLLALLPATEADPVAEQAVEKMAAAFGERTVFVLSSRDAQQAKAAAQQLGVELRASGAFRSVIAQLPPFDLSSIAALYLPYRFGLLTAEDRAALQNGTFVPQQVLLQRFYSPVDSALTTPPGDDPFGWLQRYLAGLPLATSRLELEDGLLISRRGAVTDVLVNATLAGSAYDAAVQRAVRAALERAQTRLASRYPEVTLNRAGAVFYAEAARSASEREVHLIGFVSLCGIGLLLLWVFRAPRLILLGLVSTALGILFALTMTLLIFGQLHLLTLVFGASLIGEAVDYSIQYFVAWRGAGRDWDAARAARRVRPALGVALVTSMLGYAVLAGVPFAALKQIACFAMVGILTAFASVIWLLPTLLRSPAQQPAPLLFERAAWLLAQWQRVLSGRRGGFVVLLLVLGAVPGWLQLSSDDDVRLLIQRDPALVAQEKIVRAAVGMADSSSFFVVRGAAPEEVLQRLEALEARLAALPAAAQWPRWQSPASFVPSARRQGEAHALLERRLLQDSAGLRALLLKTGFRDEVVEAWLAAAHRAPGVLTLDAWLKTPWSQPFRHLWLGELDTVNHTYAAVALPQGVAVSDQMGNQAADQTAAQATTQATTQAALLAVAHDVPGVSLVDKAASVSSLFRVYRQESALWLAGAVVLVAVLLSWRYGVRGGLLTTLPVVLAIGVTLAVFGYLRVPLSLFNSLALMLVLGVGANYAVFLREGAARSPAELGAVWAGVLLSAATTLLSFGLLTLSAMPALHSFGMTLALGIAVSVLFAPLGLAIPLTPALARSSRSRL
ncbi:MMPL family transporter [Paraburkholderia bonniea]|uniref:MMPL family transporter n=1 Tax=Paraburkholderia bonniea TaxID=2152891 RepID=UPI0025732087|nr:MMPL family transporter [Paraburkholderia bonniea]WJF91338.1 MMPL family transporter [Paraburkholderia bonniea]WJF94653.1 MMPL family transporter [Paraburkholderia bonniea]